jgi:hypothetical protein
MSDLELDPRWEWIDVSSYGEMPGTTFVKGRCNYLKVETVHNLDGEVVALLCTTCDTRWYAGRTLDET